MGFSRRPPIDPGRAHAPPEYTAEEIDEVLTALRAEAPEALALVEREARTPGSVPMSDHDDAYDRLLTVLFERGFVHTHIEMAMVFRAVRERSGKTV
ncbi:hypothetical protein [Caulobacter vibrioides]|uniref:Uncharacterized protein n=1 Tax=Caulobacter vibrioides (strain NA1000 / CB15N) TaxID=565050 RepID=A0A0H3C2R0_CAUVN|nr:hypothetical protein [Caulobacter vibrioides]YP_002515473.1 hypothetical protein CCNA_00098 [Caulobacter vibrioides NA1000]ACL93565.1 hypothetical protein CCNA_00098 [Caulobacter vibrioides NA1000]ATC26935.1 hypothetical protein CA607_00500 [Caulobacter vibrioides]QXZ52194.1 hypothetical protein KZH45_00515 [Caulobacter vibrioides]